MKKFLMDLLTFLRSLEDPWGGGGAWRGQPLRLPVQGVRGRDAWEPPWAGGSPWSNLQSSAGPAPWPGLPAGSSAFTSQSWSPTVLHVDLVQQRY